MPRRRGTSQPSLKSPDKEEDPGSLVIDSEDESPQKIRNQDKSERNIGKKEEKIEEKIISSSAEAAAMRTGMRTRGKNRLTRSPKHVSEADDIQGSSDQMQSVSPQPCAVVEPIETTFTNLQPPIIIDNLNESNQPGDGKQQNLSLEALCQAAKSELQIISKEKGQEKELEVPQPVLTLSNQHDLQLPESSVLQVASESDTPNIVIADQGSSEAEVFNLVQVSSPDGGDAWVLKPVSKKVLYPGNITPGTSNTEQQIITLPYSPSDPGRVHYVGQQDMDRQIGRKRKHPAKPGKHICPYCSRGCAKPSVLEKHIRAHTGERPYPCAPCGFSFKTKSNLYKHCKSRAHQMKVASSTSISSQTSSMEIDDLDDEDGSSFDSDVAVASTSKIKQESVKSKPGTKLILPLLQPAQRSSPVVIGQGGPPVMVLLKPGQDGTSVIKPASPSFCLTPSPQIPKELTTIVKTSIQPKTIYQQSTLTIPSTATSVNKFHTTPTVVISPPGSHVIDGISSQHPLGVTLAKSADISFSPIGDDYASLKSTVEKLPGNSMKVTIQLPKPEHTDVGIKNVHGLITPVGLPRTPLGTPNIPAVPKLPAPAKNLTPDELKERISYLIDANQAIVNTPMAEPPRPKRFARQRSEILLGTTDNDGFSSGTFSDGTHLTTGSLTPKDKISRAASFDVGQLKKVELSGIENITGTRECDLVSVIPLTKVDASVRNSVNTINKSVTSVQQFGASLSDVNPSTHETELSVSNLESSGINLSNSILNKDSSKDNHHIILQTDEKTNPSKLNERETDMGVINISDDDSGPFQGESRMIVDDQINDSSHSPLSANNAMKVGSVKEFLSPHSLLNQSQGDQENDDLSVIHISLETNDINEDFSEAGKSFACMECHFIFSNLKDVMTHLVETCNSVRSGSGNHKIDVFNTDGSHSVLTVVAKPVSTNLQASAPTIDTNLNADVSEVPVNQLSPIVRTVHDNLIPVSEKSEFQHFTVGSSAPSLSKEQTVIHTVDAFTIEGESSMSLPTKYGGYGNVVVEMVDPTAPLKRGRPKGSRNRPKESMSSNEGSFSSDVGDSAFVGAWKTPPVGGNQFNFPNKSGSHEISPLSQEVDVIQVPVTKGMFEGYRSATASMRTPTRSPLRLNLSPPSGTVSSISSPLIIQKQVSPSVKLTPSSLSSQSHAKVAIAPKGDIKMALQNHILMKRSLSVEKLAQEKQRHLSVPVASGNSLDISSDMKLTVQSNHPISKSLKVKDMLRPTRSLEELPAAKRPKLQRQASIFEVPPESTDIGINTSLKSKEITKCSINVVGNKLKSESASSNSLANDSITNGDIQSESLIVPPKLTVAQDIKDVLSNIIRHIDLYKYSSHSSDVNIPYNKDEVIATSNQPTEAPYFRMPSCDNGKLQLINLPKSVALKIPGIVKIESEDLGQVKKDSNKEENMDVTCPDEESKCISNKEQNEQMHLETGQTSTEESKNTSNIDNILIDEPMQVENQKEKNKSEQSLSESRRRDKNEAEKLSEVKEEAVSEQPSGIDVKVIDNKDTQHEELLLPLSDGSVLTINPDMKDEVLGDGTFNLKNLLHQEKGDQLCIPEHLQDKENIVMMLLGHSYPVLKTNTHGTLCSISKPQPMYVKQTENLKLSMYSTWRAAPYNPNPEGLTTKQLLNLYQHSMSSNNPYFIRAESDDNKNAHVTDSVQWENKVKTDCESEGTLSESAYSIDTVKNELYHSDKMKSGVIFSLKEVPSKGNKHVVGSKDDSERPAVKYEAKPKTALQSTISVQSIPHQSSEDQAKDLEDNGKKNVYILPTNKSLDSQVVNLGDGNFEMQNFSLQGSEYILLKPKYQVFTAQQKRHQLQAHGLKGFKSEESYTYVRGRGRGKYVCQECGIRCKKPSMLRKHLKTHTDMRPYHCKYCKFSFKTKGNLTKHMKSKAHTKKCTEMGIYPVPVYVDDSCILTEEQMAVQNDFIPGDEDQQSEQTVIIDGTFHSTSGQVSGLSAMGSSVEDDDDMDEDEDSVDQIEEIEEEQVSFDNMLVLDAPEQPSTSEQQQHKTIKSEEKFITVKNTENGEHMILKLSKDKDGQTRTEILPLTPEYKQKLKDYSSRDSVDNEVANSLLDLAQRSQNDTDRESIKKEDKFNKTGHRLEGLIGQLEERTGDAKGHDASFAVIDHPLLYATTDSKTKDITNSNHPVVVKGEPGLSWSGFVPPVFTEEVKSEKEGEPPPLVLKFPSGNIKFDKIKELVNQVISEKLKPGQKVVVQGVESANLPPVIGDITPPEKKANEIIISEDQLMVENIPEVFVQQATTKSVEVKTGSVEYKAGSSSTTSTKSDVQYVYTTKVIQPGNSEKLLESTDTVSKLSQMKSGNEEKNSSSKTLMLQRPDILDRHLRLQRQKSQDEDDEPGLQNYLNSIQHKQYDDKGKKVVGMGVKIKPIPGRVSQSELEKVDGKYVCKICGKLFQEGHLLQQHLKVHEFEQPFRCIQCMTSFRTSELLERHNKSEAHLATLNLKKRLGLVSTNDPRPYKCPECSVAFRIHGHLAKHLRSKMHIMQLENVGKIPMGTSMELEKIGPQMNVLDAESCLQDILSMIDSGVIKVDQTSNIIRPEFASKQIISSSSSSSIERPTISKTVKSVSRGTSLGSYVGGSIMMNAPTKSSTIVSHRSMDSPLMVAIDTHERDRVSATNTSSNLLRKQNDRVKVEIIKSDSVVTLDSQPVQTNSTTSLPAPHKCGICGNSFAHIEFLKEHLVSHAELRPYVCEFCDAGFTTAKSLQGHLLSHWSPSKNYACANCGMVFSEINELVKHSHQCLKNVPSHSNISVKTNVIAQKTNNNQQAVQRSKSINPRSLMTEPMQTISVATASKENSVASHIEIVKSQPTSMSREGGNNVQVIPLDSNAVQMKEVMQKQADGSQKAMKVMVINWDSIQGSHHENPTSNNGTEAGNSSGRVDDSNLFIVNDTNVESLKTSTLSEQSNPGQVPLSSTIVVPNTGSLFDPAVHIDVNK